MSLPYNRLNDPDLVIWSTSFSSHINNDFATFGITKDQALNYAALNTGFADALTA